MSAGIEDLDPELRSALQTLVAAFRRRRSQRFERRIRENLPAFTQLQNGCDNWGDIAELLNAAGVRTADGGAIRAEVLRVQVGRARRAAAGRSMPPSPREQPSRAKAAPPPVVVERRREPQGGLIAGRQTGTPPGPTELRRRIAEIFESEE